MKFKRGDIVNVSSGSILKNTAHSRMQRAVVVEPNTNRSSPRVAFLDPPKELEDYCRDALAHQGGLWAVNDKDMVLVADATDEEWALVAAFLLTGEFVRLPNTIRRKEK